MYAPKGFEQCDALGMVLVTVMIVDVIIGGYDIKVYVSYKIWLIFPIVFVRSVGWMWYGRTETEMSSLWNFHHWLHWKLSKWQLPVQPVIKISSKWRHFRFSEIVKLVYFYQICYSWNVKQRLDL